VIADLPTNLSTLDPEQLEQAKRDRDERMSILFSGWPSVNEAELRELRKLSNERQRLARHVGTRRRLHALRARPARPVAANV
jgi:hypothetical protein